MIQKILSSSIIKIVFLIVILFHAINPIYAATIIPNKSVTVSLKQQAIDAITVQYASVENNNAETYQLNLSNNFYTLKTYDQSGTELWTGQVENKQTIVVETEDPTTGHLTNVSYKTKTPEFITLHLPYHQESKYVKIFNQQGRLLIEINLDLYSITSTDRFTECDECGYCKGTNPPQNWQTCRACLYPGSSSDHLKGDTLLINPSTDKSAFRGNGRAFTDFGCLVSPAGFTSAEGRASTVQFFMRVIYTVTGAIAMLALLYGAFLIMSAKADTEQINRGKRIIYRTIIGTIIIYLGVFLISFIGTNILRLPGFGR